MRSSHANWPRSQSPSQFPKSNIAASRGREKTSAVSSALGKTRGARARQKLALSVRAIPRPSEHGSRSSGQGLGFVRTHERAEGSSGDAQPSGQRSKWRLKHALCRKDGSSQSQPSYLRRRGRIRELRPRTLRAELGWQSVNDRRLSRYPIGQKSYRLSPSPSRLGSGAMALAQRSIHQSEVSAAYKTLPATAPPTPLLNKFTNHVIQAKTPADILDDLDEFASSLLPINVLGVGRMPQRTSDWRS